MFTGRTYPTHGSGFVLNTNYTCSQPMDDVFAFPTRLEQQMDAPTTPPISIVSESAKADSKPTKPTGYPVKSSQPLHICERETTRNLVIGDNNHFSTACMSCTVNTTM